MYLSVSVSVCVWHFSEVLSQMHNYASVPCQCMCVCECVCVCVWRHAQYYYISRSKHEHTHLWIASRVSTCTCMSYAAVLYEYCSMLFVCVLYM